MIESFSHAIYIRHFGILQMSNRFVRIQARNGNETIQPCQFSISSGVYVGK